MVRANPFPWELGPRPLNASDGDTSGSDDDNTRTWFHPKAPTRSGDRRVIVYVLYNWARCDVLQRMRGTS